MEDFTLNGTFKFYHTNVSSVVNSTVQALLLEVKPVNSTIENSGYPDMYVSFVEDYPHPDRHAEFKSIQEGASSLIVELHADLWEKILPNASNVIVVNSTEEEGIIHFFFVFSLFFF